MQHRAATARPPTAATARAAPPRPSAKRQRAERDHGRDLLRGEPQHRVRAEADRTAAQGIQPDVMADRVAHEGDQREPRIGHARAGEPESQGVVQGQAAVAGRRQQHRAPELRGLDRPHVRQDVPPPVLADDVMQPEQRQPKQGDPEQRRPRRDLVELCVEVSSRVSYQGDPRRRDARGTSPRRLSLRLRKLLGLWP